MHFKMSSAICFNLDQSKNLSSGNFLGSRGDKVYYYTDNKAGCVIDQTLQEYRFLYPSPAVRDHGYM